MAKALEYKEGGQPARRVDWRRRISDHVAWGLLVYTGLHIYVTVGAMASRESSILPYFSLVVLVGAIIPACRWLEKQWEGLDENAAHDPAYAARFRRDVAITWLCAIGLPFLLTGIFKAIVAIN